MLTPSTEAARPSFHKCLPGGSRPSWPAAKDSVWRLISEPRAGVCPAEHCPLPAPVALSPSHFHPHAACAGPAPKGPVAAGNEAAPMQPGHQPPPPR